MSRTELQDANEAVVAAADAYYDAIRASWPERIAAGNRLASAIENRRAALAKQVIDDDETYLRDGAHSTEIAARQAAMLVRSTWRACIHALLTDEGPLSDAEIENVCRRRWFGRRVRVGDYYFDRLSEPKHQTVSSARKSLCDNELVVKDSIVEIDGRPHIRWRAVPPKKVPDA